MSPSTTRLSPLDASFLDVETDAAHMHVGWAATFATPADGDPRPSFEQLRDHISSRLCRAPRYRQKLADVPLGVNDPVWIDDDEFDIARHVLRAGSASLEEIAADVMSQPLARDRPLWEMWVAERLDDGRVGVVGKAHHCMVDGIAAVELGSLILDPTPDTPPTLPDGWVPAPPPSRSELLADAVRDRVADGIGLATLPLRLLTNPAKAADFAEGAVRSVRALVHAFEPAPPSVINEPISPRRHLAHTRRSLNDLGQIKKRFGTTLNDVLLAVSSGAMRRYLERRSENAVALKTMVPVNVKDGRDDLGNHISFTFVDLPCDEPNPQRRLEKCAGAMRARKSAGEPEAAEQVLNALGFAPRIVREAVSRVMAQPRTFNLTVSNIPGPRVPLWMKGCRLEEVYPVVPIPDGHALAIGLTTLENEAFFGIYADEEAMPDAQALARSVDESIDELLALT
jgi:diacylglycerol O-acyltransferase / wax synthase